MITHLLRQGRTLWTVGLWVTVTMLLMSTPQISAMFRLNWAQLLRLHAAPADAASILVGLLTNNSSNEHLRWQAASTSAAAGQSKRAIELLTSSKQPQGLDLMAQGLLLELLIGEGEIDDALDYYQTLVKLPSLSSSTASTLFLAALEEIDSLEEDRLAILVRDALDFTDVKDVRTGSIEFAYLLDHLQTPNIWNSILGQRIVRAAQWKKQQSISSHSSHKESKSNSIIDVQIADYFQIPLDAMKKGPNLVVNANFDSFDDQTSAIGGWRYVLLNGCNLYSFQPNETNCAAFVSGLDDQTTYGGNSTLRIDGIQMENNRQLSPAIAAYQHNSIEMPINAWYVVQFAYRTLDMDEPNLQIWLAQDYGFSLPSTSGEWNIVAIVALSGKDGQVIQPMLKSASLGSVWFAAFSVNLLELSAPLQFVTPVPFLVIAADENISSE